MDANDSHPSGSVRAWLASIFRLGSVPGSPEEARQFLETRLRLYLGFSAWFWAAVTVIATGLGVLTEGMKQLQGMNGLRALTHVLGALVMAATLGFLRRSRSSLRALSQLDLLVMLVQSVLIAVLTLCSLDVVRYRPDTAFTLGLAYCLIARAAVVPSTASRTIIVGTLASVPLLAATFALHTWADARGEGVRQHYADEVSLPIHFVLWIAALIGLGVALSAFVSHVIYGLQREIQRALMLGQYTLESIIGSGGMGVVYRAKHAFLRRPTAVKLLPKEHAGDVGVARFEREVQITSQLTHPNTVAIYDYGRTPEGVFYYAMEFLDGLDLQTLVDADGPQPPARVVHLLKQITGALGEAHAAGLIHRDVKPSNVIVCKRPLLGDVAKVLDFGLARDFQQADAALSQTGMVVGTPLYMAPEQIRSGDALDARSDIYALGALGYFLLSAAPVFVGRSVVEVCAHHMHSAPTPPSEHLGYPLPTALERLILECLAKAPEDRPRDAEALLARLEACEVEPWTASKAFAWWAERATRVHARRPREPERSGRTMAVARSLASS